MALLALFLQLSISTTYPPIIFHTATYIDVAALRRSVLYSVNRASNENANFNRTNVSAGYKIKFIFSSINFNTDFFFAFCGSI